MNLKALLICLLFLCAVFPCGAAPGSYRDIGESKEAALAADFAVKAQTKKEAEPITFTAITKAEQQVVAGMNYRLTLQVTQGKKPREAKVVVFHALDSHYELTSWEWQP